MLQEPADGAVAGAAVPPPLPDDAAAAPADIHGDWEEPEPVVPEVEVEAEAGADGDGAVAEAAAEMEHRAPDGDGWPRLWLPSRRGYVRLSANAQMIWDMRGVCLECTSTLTRTCKVSERARRGTKAFGQGRPLGKVWAWIKHGDALGPGHSAEAHKAFQPSQAARRTAREEASAQPGAEEWLAEERAIDPTRDLPDGEPIDLP